MTTPTRSVAIFTSREDADTLRRTVTAVLVASAAHRTTIDILVDNNPQTATALEGWSPSGLASGSTMRLWLLPWGDKACAWNRYLHELAPASDVAFFVDGYARPTPGSLTELARALDGAPEAWAATALPSVGRSAPALRRTLIAEGGLHGSLYALRGSTVALFRRRAFRLPLGLYRNDSLVGAVAAFAGDPATQSWNPKLRIAVAADATWDTDAPPFGVARIVGHFRRRLRQAQGDLENAAVRRHLAIDRRPPEALPGTLQSLLATVPQSAFSTHGPFQRFLLRKAARRVAQLPQWGRCDAPPRLLQTWEGEP